MFTWAQKRQLAVFIAVLAVAVLVLGGLFFYFFGGGGAEEEILAGQNFSILWSRFFKSREGFVDLAALIENPNDFPAGKFKYSFKIYDPNNVLIAIKEGESYAGPKEKLVIFEPNAAVFERIPQRVILDIENIAWEKEFEKGLPIIDLLGVERFLEDIFPRVVVYIKNRGGVTYQNIESTVVLWKNDDEAIGVSRTVISSLGIDEEKKITFTWPESLSGVSKIEVFFRYPL